MNSFIMKYLVVKMYLGYGYSATHEEICKCQEFLKTFGIETDFSWDENYITEINKTYYANYKIDLTVIELKDIEYIDLLKEFIKNNSKDVDLTNDSPNEEALTRAENLTIYLISGLNGIDLAVRNNKATGRYLEDINENNKLDNKYITLFKEISTYIAKLLQNSEEEQLDLENLKIASVDPNEIISAYKAYCNYQILDRNLDNILSKYFEKEYNLAMVFGTSKYYGQDNVDRDMIFISRNGDMYGPIYICVCNAPDWQANRIIDQGFARKLINKLIK